MISLPEVKEKHDRLVEEFGGGKGVRDEGLLEAAIYRPYSTFDQQDLYPTSIEKAAAIFESLVINHPFIDGNKRIAYAMMRNLLLNEGIDIKATQDEKYSFVISASTGEIRYDKILMWLKDHVVEIK